MLCVLLETFSFKYLLFLKSWILHSQMYFVRIFRNNFCSPHLIGNAQGIKISLYFLAERSKHWSLLVWPFWYISQLTWILVLAVKNSMLKRVIKLIFRSPKGSRTPLSSLFSPVNSSMLLVPRILGCVLAVRNHYSQENKIKRYIRHRNNA